MHTAGEIIIAIVQGYFIAIGFFIVYVLGYVALAAVPIALIFALFQLTRAWKRRLPKNKTVTNDSKFPLSEKSLQNVNQYIIHWAVTVVPPLLLFFALTAMEWRAKILIGHWPQVMADDPKWIGENDGIYQFVYTLTDYSFGLAGWSFVLWLGLFVSWYQNYTPRQRKLIAWGFVIVWMIVEFGTGNLVGWYLD